MLNITTDCVTLVDESGIEIIVSYSSIPVYGDSPWPEGREITLHGVEVVIKGTGIDILPFMNTKQIHAIQTEVEDSL